MYAKCSSIDDASKVVNKMTIRDVVIWTAMINGYVKIGQGHKALEVYRQMQAESVSQDSSTFLGVLNACGSVGDPEKGKQVHEDLTQSGREFDSFFGSSLVDMYTKCGSLEDAQNVFIRMPIPDVVSWNAMILGYVKCGQGQKALKLSQQMELRAVRPNSFTFVAVLNVCASVAALDEGRRVHAEMVQSGCEVNLFLGHSLIDIYAKCGSVDDARRVYDKMHTRDIVFWNTMPRICHAWTCPASFQSFPREMCREGFRVNTVTFLNQLSACSQAGFVEEGLYYFEAMTSLYSILASVDHYACMVDLLGGAGRVNKA